MGRGRLRGLLDRIGRTEGGGGIRKASSEGSGRRAKPRKQSSESAGRLKWTCLLVVGRLAARSTPATGTPGATRGPYPTEDRTANVIGRKSPKGAERGPPGCRLRSPRRPQGAESCLTGAKDMA